APQPGVGRPAARRRPARRVPAPRSRPAPGCLPPRRVRRRADAGRDAGRSAAGVTRGEAVTGRVRRAAALVVALALAGCDGTAHRATSKPPRLPRDLAQAWAAQAGSVADALAAGDGCTALQRADDLRGAVV